jgi:integrase/recombinase XerD
MTLKEYIEQKYSATAVGNHYCNAMRYVSYMGDRAEQATYKEVLEYVEMLRTQNLHAKTIKNYFLGVKLYYNYLQKIGIRNDHPCRKMVLKDQINRAIPLESLYSEAELMHLKQNYRSVASKFQQRNQVVIGLLIHQALTTREVANLQLSDIDLEKGELFIRSEGHLKSRRLSLIPEQIMQIYRYINESRSRFTAHSQEATNTLIVTEKGVGVNHTTIHNIVSKKAHPQEKYTAIKIRQSVIKNLLRNNNLRVVQVFAGHRRSSSTEAYKESGLEDLKTQVQKFHPLQ